MSFSDERDDRPTTPMMRVLASIAIEHDTLVERLSDHGTMLVAQPGTGPGRWQGKVLELGDHASLELDGLREDELRAIFAALERVELERASAGECGQTDQRRAS